MALIISPRKLALILAAIALFLGLAHFSSQFLKYVGGHDVQFGLIRLFDMQEEGNVPAWYSTLLLFMACLFLAVIGLAKKHQGDRYALHWLGLSAIFLYLSLDEAAAIHEMVDDPINKALLAKGYLSPALAIIGTAWVIVGVLFVFTVFVMYLRFLISLPVKTRNLFIFAGTVFITGAIGLEILQNKYDSVHGWDNFPVAVMVGAEETMEMTGVVIFLYAMSSYMAAYLSEVRILVKDALPAPAYRSVDIAAATPQITTLPQSQVKSADRIASGS